MEEIEPDDILKFAIDREAQANRFYIALAERMADADMQDVFEIFAAQELEHKALLELELMKTGKVVVSKEIASWFEADGAADVATVLHMDYKNALAIGIEKERASFRLYADWMATAQDEEQREILLSLAEEEAKHMARLEIEYDMLVKNQ
jgi:rubrerythrin